MLSKKHKLIGVAAAALCATAVFGVGYSVWSIASSTATLSVGVDVQGWKARLSRPSLRRTGTDSFSAPRRL